MTGSYKTLSKIKKFHIDEQRKALGVLMEQESKTEQAIKKLEEELETEKEFSQTHDSPSFGAYLKKYLKTRAALDLELKNIQTEVEKTKDIIAGLFKEQKTYDIVERHLWEKKLEEENLIEQKMLDEIGTNRYLKKSKNSS